MPGSSRATRGVTYSHCSKATESSSPTRPPNRSVKNLVRNLLLARRLLQRPSAAASFLTTGAAVAVPFAWVARLRGVPHRLHREPRPRGAPLAQLQARRAGCRPHLCPVARVACRVPRGTLRRNGLLAHDDPRRRRSQPVPVRPPPARGCRAAAGRAACRTTWAVVDSPPSTHAACRSFRSTTSAELVREARIVVTHAGVGSILLALTNGKRPFVVPRLRAFGETVDDHQLESSSTIRAGRTRPPSSRAPNRLGEALVAAGDSEHEAIAAPAEELPLVHELRAYLRATIDERERLA